MQAATMRAGGEESAVGIPTPEEEEPIELDPVEPGPSETVIVWGPRGEPVRPLPGIVDLAPIPSDDRDDSASVGGSIHPRPVLEESGPEASKSREPGTPPTDPGGPDPVPD